MHLSPDASTKAVSWESGIELVVGNGALQHLPVIDFRCLEWIVGSDALAVVGTGAGKLYVIGPANGGRMTPGIPTEMPSSPVHFCRQVGKWVAAVVGPSGASDLYIYQLCDGKLNHAFESTLLQEVRRRSYCFHRLLTCFSYRLLQWALSPRQTRTTRGIPSSISFSSA